MGDGISRHQNVFVERRQILDCGLIANEIIGLQIEGGGMVFNVDTMQAYNHISWNFLELVMAKTGYYVLRSCQ